MNVNNVMKVYQEQEKNHIKNFHGVKYYSWSYDSYKDESLIGVGKKKTPFICVDKYLDDSYDKEIHSEICNGLLENLISRVKNGFYFGALPPFERKKFNRKDGWTEMLNNIENFDKENYHKSNIINIISNSQKNSVYLTYKIFDYFVLNMGSPPAYHNSFNLIANSHIDKHNSEGEKIVENIKYFPKLIKYVDSFPLFDVVGKVTIFTSYYNMGILTHRDWFIAPHKRHAVVINFDKTYPFFLWDCKKEKKIYLNQESKKIIFNNSDYHGVDPEPDYKYYVRIDGIFKDWFCEELSLENGYIHC